MSAAAYGHDGRGELTRDERLGYLRVCVATGYYLLARNEREQLDAALVQHRLGQRADPWYEGRDNYGAAVKVDLALVEGVIDNTPESIALADEDARILRLRGD